METMIKREAWWMRGYIAALAALAQFEEDTMYDEVVDAAGGGLVEQARKDGAMRWSGLTGYVRRQRVSDD